MDAERPLIDLAAIDAPAAEESFTGVLTIDA
jgi:hypothetical protein